jgi:hypothetical protein
VSWRPTRHVLLHRRRLRPDVHVRSPRAGHPGTVRSQTGHDLPRMQRHGPPVQRRPGVRRQRASVLPQRPGPAGMPRPADVRRPRCRRGSGRLLLLRQRLPGGPSVHARACDGHRPGRRYDHGRGNVHSLMQAHPLSVGLQLRKNSTERQAFMRES